MKQWKVTQLGDPEEALELLESTKPIPGEDEVLLKVEAAALNFFDILQCQGKYQERPEIPFTPGAEVSGIIEEIGPGVNLKVGQHVLATPSLPNGGLSQWVVVNKELIFPISGEMPYSKAAALFTTYQTAYFALHRNGCLKSGETLLVHAGSGGVGSAAIQLGKAAGARVIATAGSAEKLEICRKFGADMVINYNERDFVQAVKDETDGNGADVIFDPVGGDTFDLSRKCINFEGRILVIGFAGGRIANAPTNHALIKNYAIVGIHFGYFRKLYPEKVKEAHLALMDLYDQGKIDPLIYQAYSFEKVPEALNELSSRKTWGKLIVKPNLV